jgi:hypothetical protein
VADAVVPEEGCVFQLATIETPGINRPKFRKLLEYYFHRHGLRRDDQKGEVIHFIWIVEKEQFETFQRQDFHDAHKRVYSIDRLRKRFRGVQQYAFEVDLKRICDIQKAIKVGKAVDMTGRREEGSLGSQLKKIFRFDGG